MKRLTFGKLLCLTTGAAILAGCATQTHPSMGTDFKKAEASLKMLGKTPRYSDVLTADYPKPEAAVITGLDINKDKDVARLCGVSLGEPVQQSALTFAIGIAVDLVVDIAVQAAQEEIKKYSAVYGDKVAIPGWTGWKDKPTPDSPLFYASTRPLSLSSSCFRLVRGERDSVRKDRIAIVDMDLVGQIALTPNGDGLLIRPLRLYYGRPAPEQVNAKNGVGVAISLVLEAEAEKKFETILLAEKFKPAKAYQGEVKYYYDDPKILKNLVTYPLVPFEKSLRGPAGYAVLTVQGAETSEPNALIKWLANYAKNKQGDISDVAKKAIFAAAKIEE